jgi:stringent starvation protein B
MAERSTKPYLIRAIHEWCADSGYTPYLSVKVDDNTRVPVEFIKDGEIVLNLSYDATHKLTIGNDVVQFSARFGGVSRECSIPMSAVAGIFARENGQGLYFAPDAELPAGAMAQGAGSPAGGDPESPPPAPSSTPPRPTLQIVK